MLLVRGPIVSSLLLLAVACGPAGPKDDPLLALTGSQVLPDPSTLDANDPVLALIALDGISTVAPIAFETGVPLNGATVIAGRTVRLFEFAYNAQHKVAYAFVGELAPSEFSATANGSRVVILPLKPLKPRTCYMAVLTRKIRDIHGRKLRRGPQAAAAGVGNGKRGMVAYQLAKIARKAKLPPGQIARIRSFRTQSVREVLASVYQNTTSRPVQLFPTFISTEMLGLPGGADIYVGTIDVPMYSHPLDPLGAVWKTAAGENVDAQHPQPALQAVIQIPVIMTIPNVDSGHTKPADGWDVVIYQHGITRLRTDMLSVAGSMATAGQAVIAIDLPLHGDTNTTSPFYQPGRERTLDLDLVNNATLAPGSDGIIDDSGTFFINLQSLLTFRDNGRQAVSDLFTLTRSIPNIDYDGGGADFDADDIRFFGLSLGGIVGTPYIAIEDGIDAVSLGMVSGGVARVLHASPFGAIVDGTLAAQGIFPGTPQYEFYWNAMQTVFDAADPVNFAREAAEKHPIHLMQMRGDPVVVNSLPAWPLTGTEPLAALMNLTPISSTVIDPNGVRGFVIFTDEYGVSHQPHLEPTVTPRVTVEMVSSTVVFLASGGTVLLVSDPGAIE